MRILKIFLTLLPGFMLLYSQLSFSKAPLEPPLQPSSIKTSIAPLPILHIGVPDLLGTGNFQADLEPIIKLLTLAYEQIGYNMKVVMLPTLRAEYMSKLSKIDGELIRVEGYENKVRQLIKVPAVILKTDVVAIGKEPVDDAFSIDTVSNYAIGCLRGIVVTEVMCKQAKRELTTNSVGQLVDVLDKGRVDMIFVFNSPNIVNDFHLDKSPYHRYSPAIAKFSGFHYVNQRHQKLVAPLAKAIKRLQKLEP